LLSSSQSTLPGTAFSSRSQAAKTGLVIFQALLKLAKMNPLSGSPAWARDGAGGAGP